MDTAVRQSRWDDSPELGEKGAIVPLTFTGQDLEICKLLAPSTRVRDPWSYQYLPTSYVSLLLGRDKTTVRQRLTKLYRRPYSYVGRPEQPRNNYRDLIYASAKNGIDELREAGFPIRETRLRKLPHELLSCIIAASFEFGAKKRKLQIDTDVKLDLEFYPDRPVFKLDDRYIFIEADTGSMTIERQEEGTDICGKYEQYLNLERRVLKRSAIVFVTTREARRDSMIVLLKRVIDKHHLDHELAASFIFGTIEYDRFINKIPKLTDWAIASNYKRAGFDPFNFLKD